MRTTGIYRYSCVLYAICTSIICQVIYVKIFFTEMFMSNFNLTFEGRQQLIISLGCSYKCQHAPILAPFFIFHFLHHMSLNLINPVALFTLLINYCAKTQYSKFMIKYVLKDLIALICSYVCIFHIICIIKLNIDSIAYIQSALLWFQAGKLKEIYNIVYI